MVEKNFRFSDVFVSLFSRHSLSSNELVFMKHSTINGEDQNEQSCSNTWVAVRGRREEKHERTNCHCCAMRTRFGIYFLVPRRSVIRFCAQSRSAFHWNLHDTLLPLSSFPLSFSHPLFSIVFYEKPFFRTLPEIPEDSRTFRFLSLSGSLPSVRALSFCPLSDTLSSVRALSSCLPLGRRSVSLMGRRKALAVEIAPNATLKPLNRQMVQNKVAGRHRDTKGILMRIFQNLTGSHFEVCLTSQGFIEEGYCC